MSAVKRFLENISEVLGFRGEINNEVIKEGKKIEDMVNDGIYENIKEAFENWKMARTSR